MDYFGRISSAREETRKKTATEKMNLKITTAQIKSYTEKQTMPTLQYLADELCEDIDMEYVKLKEKEQASLEKIIVGETDSILTKLKEYPYEFEIDKDLKLASINGIKIANNEIPEGYIKPEGEKEITITENGTTTEDVKEYANIKINVDVNENLTNSKQYIMLPITITGVSGGEFTINVNNNGINYGTLYYYVDDILVYEGTEYNFRVTNINGTKIKEQTSYDIKVLAEPLQLSIETNVGDKVDVLLSKIGNSNEYNYTVDNLNDLFNNTELMNSILNSASAKEYLLSSTLRILPAYLNKNDTNINNFSQFSLIPTLSNDTNVIYSTCYNSNRAGYKAFDGTINNWWVTQENKAVGAYIGYAFSTTKEVDLIEAYNSNTIDYEAGRCKQVKLQYSDDNSTWNDASDVVTAPNNNGHFYVYNTKNKSAHRYWRLYIISSYGYLSSISEMKFYGK